MVDHGRKRRAESITLRQLLSFTSGFVGGTGLGNDAGIPCVEERETTFKRVPVPFMTVAQSPRAVIAYRRTLFLLRSGPYAHRGRHDGAGNRRSFNDLFRRGVFSR